MTDWQAIVTGDRAATLLAVVEEIDQALSRVPPEAFTPDLETPSPPPGVAAISVHPHLALWPVHFQQATGRESRLDTVDLLEQLLAEGPLATSTGLFGSGPLAAAWVYAHLVDLDPEDDPGNDPIGELEAVIADGMSRSPWEHRYELVDGLIGGALLLRERQASATARAALAQVQLRLLELSRQTGHGRSWHTLAKHGPPAFLETEPDGRIDLGYAHGMLGIFSLIADLLTDGLATATSVELLEQGIHFLLQHEIDGPLRFPAWLPVGGEPWASRLGWCYGDLGVAVLLVKAGNATGNAAWVRLGTEIGLRLTGVSIGDSRVVEGGLCHGAASAAHLFHRLYQATGEPALRDQALLWFDHLLSFRRPGLPLGGFQTLRKNFTTGEMVQVLDATLLSGVLGMGLSLLAALADEEPSWDRILGVNIPPWQEPAASQPPDG